MIRENDLILTIEHEKIGLVAAIKQQIKFRNDLKD